MSILLTSVGRRSYIVEYFKDAVGNEGKVFAANSEETYAMHLADEYVCSPLIYDKNYIDFILNYCIENDINMVISLFDVDLPVLAKAKLLFESKKISVIISDEHVIETCNDKWMSYVFLKNNGFNVPATFIEMNNLRVSIENGRIEFPLVVKPRWGMGSKGIYYADNFNELSVLYEKSKMEILSTYLRYESTNDIETSVLVQEKIDGEEYGLDILNDLQGNHVFTCPKKKLAMRAGETDKAIIIDNNELLNLGKKLSSKLRHIGNLDVDCFLMNDKFYILEMNCRFGGQYPFSHMAGVNFPRAIVQMVKKERVSTENLNIKTGTVGIKDIVPKVLKFQNEP